MLLTLSLPLPTPPSSDRFVELCCQLLLASWETCGPIHPILGSTAPTYGDITGTCISFNSISYLEWWLTLFPGSLLEHWGGIVYLLEVSCPWAKDKAQELLGQFCDSLTTRGQWPGARRLWGALAFIALGTMKRALAPSLAQRPSSPAECGSNGRQWWCAT
jgi:hypothetical protein